MFSLSIFLCWRYDYAHSNFPNKKLIENDNLINRYYDYEVLLNSF